MTCTVNLIKTRAQFLDALIGCNALTTYAGQIGLCRNQTLFGVDQFQPRVVAALRETRAPVNFLTDKSGALLRSFLLTRQRVLFRFALRYLFQDNFAL